MHVVAYSEKHPYRYAELGDMFPVLTVALRNPHNPKDIVEVDAYLDSGAQISVFQGWIPKAIGLDILNGRPWQLRGSSGWNINARRIHVELEYQAGRVFPLEPAFVLDELHRNLLGRDFFDLVQLGFREHHGEFFLEPAP